MNERLKALISEFALILIITIPAFYRLLNNYYFPIHDDQHIARLYLLDLGLKQGNLYPRWVDILGFGYGYPLFNFYPPAIYYISEFFHILGFSYIWSIKLMIVTGFILGAWTLYIFIKKISNRITATLASVLFTFFTYKAVLVYVRGAFAEFFASSLLPFLALTLFNLSKNPSLKKSFLFGIALALLILSHFIALPTLFFLGILFLLFFFLTREKKSFTFFSFIGILIGISLSFFYWFPSLAERSATLINEISITELYNYKLHFIYSQQFWYSAWGFGGSTAGPIDGMSFQLGKVYIFLTLVSLTAAILYFLKERKLDIYLKFFFVSFLLLIFSLFMTTSYSVFFWDNIPYLRYLQFPWRFLSFVTFFISITCAYSIFFLNEILNRYNLELRRKIVISLSLFLGLVTLFTYGKYFQPQRYLSEKDEQKISFEELAWRVSSSSIDFIPYGVKTKKTSLNTTVIDIAKSNLPKNHFQILAGEVNVQIEQNKFSEKKFRLDSDGDILFRLNTFNFPGWSAYLDGVQIPIDDRNDLKLITVNIPEGGHTLKFKFEATRVRIFANLVSFVTSGILLFYLLVLRATKVHKGK